MFNTTALNLTYLNLVSEERNIIHIYLSGLFPLSLTLFDDRYPMSISSVPLIYHGILLQ